MLTIDLTPATLADRLQQWEERRHAQLLQTAAALELAATPDPLTGGWAVRSPQRPGYIELVTSAGCTCPEYAVRQSCPHAALITDLAEAQPAALTLEEAERLARALSAALRKRLAAITGETTNDTLA